MLHMIYGAVLTISILSFITWVLLLIGYGCQYVKKTVMLYTAFYFVIIAGAYIFHENFTDVLVSSIGAFDNFRLSAGQFAYDVTLLGIGVGSIALVAYLTYLAMSKLYQRNLQKNALSVDIEQN